MARITISLPEAMSHYIGTRIHSGQYGNVSEYFRDLVRRDRERLAAVESLRTTVDTALASGISPRQVTDIVSEAEARLTADAPLRTNE